jgi:hypothetical protein
VEYESLSSTERARRFMKIQKRHFRVDQTRVFQDRGVSEDCDTEVYIRK